MVSACQGIIPQHGKLVSGLWKSDTVCAVHLPAIIQGTHGAQRLAVQAGREAGAPERGPAGRFLLEMVDGAQSV